MASNQPPENPTRPMRQPAPAGRHDRCQRVVSIHRRPRQRICTLPHRACACRSRRHEGFRVPERKWARRPGAPVPPAVRAHRVAVVGRGMRPRGFNAAKASAEPLLPGVPPCEVLRRAVRSVPPHGRQQQRASERAGGDLMSEVNRASMPCRGPCMRTRARTHENSLSHARTPRSNAWLNSYKSQASLNA